MKGSTLWGLLIWLIDWISCIHLGNGIIITLGEYHLHKQVIPNETRWNISGLSLNIWLAKAAQTQWNYVSPFITNGGQVLRLPWLHHDPNNFGEGDDEEEEGDDEELVDLNNNAVFIDENNNEVLL